MKKNSEYKALKDFWKMSEQQKYSYLIKNWALSDECVYGYIQKKEQKKKSVSDYALHNVKNINGIQLEYPIIKDESQFIKNNVSDFGIYAGNFDSVFLRQFLGKFVKAKIDIRSLIKCQKLNNPLSVKIKKPELITSIPNSFIKTDSHGSVLIEESVKESIALT